MKLEAWIDGGARGNPGPAGYGVIITDSRGRRLRERWGYLGRATNNVAEYRGLIAALESALELGAQELTVHTDSELVQRQVTGRYKIRQPHLKELAARVQELAARFARFEIEHVGRSENADADALANRAMDTRESGEREVERP